MHSGGLDAIIPGVALVEQYWSGAVKRLQAEVDVFNRLIGHAGEQGRENELSLLRVLENLIPRRLGVGSGMIIDAQDRRSRQTDIVLFDLADQPTLLAQSTQVIFPVEVTHASIEVKTTLTADDLLDCGKKRAALARLVPAKGYSVPPFIVLAYAAWASPATVAQHFRDLSADERPDLLCILDPGVVGGPLYRDSDAAYEVALIPLHERDAAGDRISGRWWPIDSVPASAAVAAEGTLYPVTRVGNQPTVGEPGRALLLFCVSLLRALAGRNAIPAPAIEHYLAGVAIEALAL